MTRLFIIEHNALGVGGHYYNYTRCIAAAAAAAGLDPVLLVNKQFQGNWDLGGLPTRKSFSLTWGEAETLARRTWGGGNIAFEFARAIRNDPPRAADHVLFHTLGFAELISLLDYITCVVNRIEMPTIHILLRYDPGFMLDDIATFRPLFRHIAASVALRRSLRFHADTQPLSEAFARLSLLPFSPLPIPFDQRYLPAPSEAAGNPLSIAYFGDARLEKGYGRLPEAISALLKNPPSRRIRFVLQSNFNTPGGEEGMLAARFALAAMPTVELLVDALDGSDYYERLSAADAIILPYDAKRYAARSSGVLVEAMAAGKPVLTSAGSWMATQVTPEHAVLWDEGSSLADAIRVLVENYDRLAEGARAIAGRWRDEATGGAFIRRLVGSAAPPLPAARTAKRILVIMNGDAMVLRNGASQVVLSQLDYLQTAGYRTSILFLGYDAAALCGSVDRWLTELADRVRGFDLEGLYATVLSDAARKLWREKSAGPTIVDDLAIHRCFAIGADLWAAMKDRPFDAVLLNYITSLPIVDRLGLSAIPVVCEIHDIQAEQKAIYGRRAVTQADIEAEFAALGRCRQLISLNGDEARRIAADLPRIPIAVTGIFPSLVANRTLALAGCVDLDEVVSSCLPAANLSDQSSRLDGLESFDLLFVGSNHLPNVTALRWFLDEIYLPRLAMLGRTIVIAGSVTDYEEWPQSPGIFYLGRLADLAPLYAAARIVVLPIRSGAGSPVKTMEGMRYGVPIVATTIAMRGIDPLNWGGIAVEDEAGAFADKISELLGNPLLRRESSRLVHGMGARLGDHSRYIDVMNSVFADLFGPGAPHVEPPSAARDTDPLALVEWSSSMAACNQLIRDAIAGRPLRSESVRLAATLPAGLRLPLLSAFADVLLTKQTAPILRAKPALLRQVVNADADRIVAAVADAVQAVSRGETG